MSDLVGDLGDRFSHVAAHIVRIEDRENGGLRNQISLKPSCKTQIVAQF